jgi:hypothetical protein
MSAGIFALLLVFLPLALAAVPAAIAFRSGALFAADFGLVLLPAPIFLAGLVAFNEPAQTGWAGIAYPFLVLWLCVLALYGRVFLLPRLGLSARWAALGTFLVAVAGAALFGAYVPPFYE